ncbi:MAG: hypothetical protein ACI80K_004093 [Paracoccaceae bacterium]|jgi:hypothetical protein
MAPKSLDDEEQPLSRAEKRAALRHIPRTKLGIACGIIAVIVGPLAILLTLGSIAAVQQTFGVSVGQSQMAGGLSPLILTYILGGGLVLGGLGLLLPKSWGWWLAIVSAAFGPLDLFRIYRSLFAAINLDNPNSDVVIRKLTLFTGVPALFYMALIALLLQRSVKTTYRISS